MQQQRYTDVVNHVITTGHHQVCLFSTLLFQKPRFGTVSAFMHDSLLVV